MKKFLLIGDGNIAKRHKYVISELNGIILNVYDPFLSNFQCLEDMLYKHKDTGIDYVVICSPNDAHYEQIKMCLKYDMKVIVEKPMILPWEPIIDDYRINTVLQLRWLDLPETAKVVEVVMPRNEEYFNSWKGDVKKTGGIFHLLFIHYIDLAERLKAKFVGKIIPEGKPVARVDDFDILNIDMNSLYSKMYNDIIYKDKGIKPSNIMYLNWILERCGFDYGVGSGVVGKTIEIDFSNGIN